MRSQLTYNALAASCIVRACALLTVKKPLASLDQDPASRSLERSVSKDGISGTSDISSQYIADADEVNGGNWCVDGTCLTGWEKEYMQNNSETLAVGLKALRQQGCVPAAQKILIGGYFRTGSTQLFNQARVWMGLAFPGSAASGVLPTSTQLDATDPSFTIVSKQHGLEHDRAMAFDVMLMSSRSVVDTVITRTDMKSDMNPENITLEAVKKACYTVLNQQGRMYRMWESTGRKVAYDTLLEDWVKDPEKEISNIAEALGVCKEAASDKALVKFIHDMTNNVRDHPGLGTRLTQMHGFQSKDHKALLRPKVMEFMEQEPWCKEWADGNARVASNYMYRTGIFRM